MGVEQGQIGKTEEMADLNKNQDPGVDSLSAARPYRPLSLRARLILLLFASRSRLNAAISAYCSSAEALAALSASSICWWRSLRAASPVAEDRLADLTLELATTAAARSASRFIEASSVADTAGISPSVIEVPLFPSKMASWRSALFA